MEMLFSSLFCDSASSENFSGHPGVEKCPFLRNINEPTSFSLTSINFPAPVCPYHLPLFIWISKGMYVIYLLAKLYHFLRVKATGAKGPIFEDGPNFDTAFRVFHGRDGGVPLSEGAFAHIEKPLPKPAPEFNPLAAKAATISLSGFGGFFSFGDFSNKRNKQNSNKKNPNNLPQVIMVSLFLVHLC